MEFIIPMLPFTVLSFFVILALREYLSSELDFVLCIDYGIGIFHNLDKKFPIFFFYDAKDCTWTEFTFEENFYVQVGNCKKKVGNCRE